MTIAPRVLIAAVALLLPSFAQAQSHPSFAGTWERVDTLPERATVAASGDAAFRKGDMGNGWGTPLTIRQSSDSIIVEYQHFSAYDLQPRTHFGFALDGAESRNAVTVGHAESVQRAHVAWRGDTLVITSRVPTPAGVSSKSTEVTQTLSLDGAGQLVLVVTRPGYRAPNVVRTTFVRR